MQHVFIFPYIKIINYFVQNFQNRVSYQTIQEIENALRQGIYLINIWIIDNENTRGIKAELSYLNCYIQHVLFHLYVSH